MIDNKPKKAFTLVEVLIVVSILGILAAIVLPSLQGGIQEARNAVAKDMLKTMRHQIELYKYEHGGTQPGYKGGSLITVEADLIKQFTNCTKKDGSISPFTSPSGDYIYGPYLPKMNANPFNGKSSVLILDDSTEFSAAADGTSSGWLYKPSKGKIRLNSTEKDRSGINVFE